MGRKWLACTLSIAVFLLAFTGCRVNQENWLVTSVITVGGSTTLAGPARQVLDAFMSDTGVAATYTPGSSAEGIIGVQRGNFDFAFASYLPTGDTGLEHHVVGTGSVCVLVHPDNPVREITMEQLRALALGEITSWAELGGEDRPVVFMGRQMGSGTRIVFEQGLGLEGLCRYDVLYESVLALGKALGANPAGIGYAPHLLDDGTLQRLELVDAPEDDPFLLTYSILWKQETDRDEYEQRFIDFVAGADVSGLLYDTMNAAMEE